MVGKKSRTKGHSFERDCAQDLRVVFPKARRHLEYQDGEANGCDLEHTGGYRFQCKRLQKYAPIERIFEVKHDPGDVPVLVTRADAKPAMAVLPWADFISLLKLALHF